MFGWFKKILKKLVAEETDQMERELREELNTEMRSRLKGELEAELRSKIKDELMTELKAIIQQEFNHEITARLLEIFAEFKQEMTEGFKEDVTGDFKQQIAEELKDEFRELQEQVMEVLRSNRSNETTRQAAPPRLTGLSAIPGKETEVMFNIGPGLKELFNDKKSPVKREILQQFISGAMAELHPDQSQAQAQAQAQSLVNIINNNNDLSKEKQI